MYVIYYITKSFKVGILKYSACVKEMFCLIVASTLLEIRLSSLTIPYSKIAMNSLQRKKTTRQPNMAS